VAFSHDGRSVAWGFSDGVIEVRGVDGDRLLHTLHGHRGIVRTLAFSPACDQLASGGCDGTLRLWDLGTPARR
jgi:WD40 repeat protein